MLFGVTIHNFFTIFDRLHFHEKSVRYRIGDASIGSGYTVVRKLSLETEMCYGDFLRTTRGTHDWKAIDRAVAHSILRGDMLALDFTFNGRVSETRMRFNSDLDWKAFQKKLNIKNTILAHEFSIETYASAPANDGNEPFIS